MAERLLPVKVLLVCCEMDLTVEPPERQMRGPSGGDTLKRWPLGHLDQRLPVDNGGTLPEASPFSRGAKMLGGGRHAQGFGPFWLAAAGKRY